MNSVYGFIQPIVSGQKHRQIGVAQIESVRVDVVKGFLFHIYIFFITAANIEQK
jgi:hypothetical protein